ncbi:MAG: hypothetical protein RLZZ324_1279, partial [Candidatus Parcubacteria bacterium]
RLGFDWPLAVLVFFTYAVIDAMYAWYTLVVTARRPFASANVSFLMHFLLAFGVLTYTSNPLYIIPLACGSWVGTFLVVKTGVGISTPPLAGPAMEE